MPTCQLTRDLIYSTRVSAYVETLKNEMADKVQKSINRILTSLDAIAERRRKLGDIASACQSGMNSIEVELQTLQGQAADTMTVNITTMMDGSSWYLAGDDNIGAWLVPFPDLQVGAIQYKAPALMQWVLSENLGSGNTDYKIINSNGGYLVWNDQTRQLRTVLSEPAETWQITKNSNGLYKIVWDSIRLLRMGMAPDWYMDPYPDVVNNNTLTDAQTYSFQIVHAVSKNHWTPP